MVHLITAVIRPHKVGEVLAELREIGVPGMTVTEVQGFGHEGGETEIYRGAEYHIDFVPKMRIEILCDTFEAERLQKVLIQAAYTGRTGDGKVWITEVASVTRIRSGEHDVDAL
jgi:nitrogen regulatory protein P-II 1